jgi:membrane protein YqaA with SNARE-associated domain
MLIKFLTVAALATFEIYAAIPAGIALNLSPVHIFLASALGGLSGTFLSAFLGDKIKAFIMRYKKAKPAEKKNKTGMVHRIWEKWGVVGLGLLGTIAVGAPASVAVGLGFNASLKKLLVWCSIGVIARSVLFTVIGYHGANLL